MANLVLMPQLGVSEESAVLARWHVSEGDAVKEGQPLFTLETGKSSFEVEAAFGGVVLALLCQTGDEKGISEPVCVIGQPGETYDAAGLLAAPASHAAEGPGQRGGAAAVGMPSQSIVSGEPGVDLNLSPRARQTAARMGVDVAQAVPTGPEGRILERDIEALAARGDGAALPAERGSGTVVPAAEGVFPQPAAVSPVGKAASVEIIGGVDGPTALLLTKENTYEDIPHSRIRKVIADNMHASLRNLAQLTHHHSFDATALLALRARCKESGNEAARQITLGDLVLFAVARTLPLYPEFNAHYTDTHLRCFAHVGLGVAIDTPRGLMVPTLPMAERMSVSEISGMVRAFATSCRAGSIAPSAMEGGTFTVSNLGAFGVEMFTPVINPPQVAILGVCNIIHRLRPGKDATAELYPAMGLSLTYDHRAVDGAPASRFMQALCKNLEEIDLLSLG